MFTKLYEHLLNGKTPCSSSLSMRMVALETMSHLSRTGQPETPSLTPKRHQTANYTFNFQFLGPRVPTILMSPSLRKAWIEKKGRSNGRDYTHTSIIAFLNNLWDINLHTPRLDFSSTFEHVFLKHPRDDNVETLPEPFPF